MSLEGVTRGSRDELIHRAGKLRREIGGYIRHSIGVNTLAPNDDVYDTPETRELHAIERQLSSLDLRAAAD